MGRGIVSRIGKNIQTIIPFTDTGLAAITGDGSVKTFTIAAPVAGVPTRLYRVKVGP